MCSTVPHSPVDASVLGAVVVVVVCFTDAIQSIRVFFSQHFRIIFLQVRMRCHADQNTMLMLIHINMRLRSFYFSPVISGILFDEFHSQNCLLFFLVVVIFTQILFCVKSKYFQRNAASARKQSVLFNCFTVSSIDFEFNEIGCRLKGILGRECLTRRATQESCRRLVGSITKLNASIKSAESKFKMTNLIQNRFR